jgi:hypothetical protein
MSQHPIDTQYAIPKRSLEFRSVFISDVHLGFRGSSAQYLLDFLKSIDVDQLYLVGDIVDVWSLKRTCYWPQEHNNVVRLILSKAKRGDSSDLHPPAIMTKCFAITSATHSAFRRRSTTAH